jgi:hypothetical protein
MVLTDQQKLGQDQKLRKYFVEWIDYIQRTVDPNVFIKKWLRKGDNFETELVDVQTRYNIVPEQWIFAERNIFCKDTLQGITDSYILRKNEGVGFVVNLENFNKEDNYLTAYYTFFDISSRNILWSAEIISFPKGRGMTDYWGYGIRSGIKIFMDKVYFKSVKKQ